MINTASGSDLRRMLAQVRRHADEYSMIVICSPFVDEELLPLIRDLADRASRRRAGFRLVTRPATAAKLFAVLPGLRAHLGHMLMLHPGLHAKVYLGLKGTNGQAIVTSANLTAAGLESNIELGVRSDTTSHAGRQLVGQACRFLRDLSFRSYGASIFVHEE